MIFVHLTMQVPMYSLQGFYPIPEWPPNLSRPCTLMAFVVTTEGTLRPWAYTQPSDFTHYINDLVNAYLYA